MVAYFWFRRDLRLEDNAGLYHSLKSGSPIKCIFIFDQNILEKLPSSSDGRLAFIHESVTNLKKELNDLGSDLIVKYGRPLSVWKEIFKENNPKAIYCNRDFEQYAIKRDDAVKEFAEANDASFHSFKDHIIFDGSEVLKDDGTPYTVFTPYKRKWLKKLESKKDNGVSFFLRSYPSRKYANKFYQFTSSELPSLKSMGFIKKLEAIPPKEVPRKIIREYSEKRDFPALSATSRLGIHFRFGTISIREKARSAKKISEVYLSELIWRDFYSQILYHFPHVEGNPFRAKYNRIEWRNNELEFKKWCSGKTGYPLVDAGMRELNQTGHMHNRVRMLVASFLTKHLLIDWRWGEQYFADKLLDFDLASNNGGWQWAAGCGTDAAPYFRIFSPESQLKKFDKQLEYVKQWVPEYGTEAYPEPMVDHKMARNRCLETYKKALANS